MAEFGESLLSVFFGAIVVAGFAISYVFAGFMVWDIARVLRERADLRRRGLPLPPRQPRHAEDWAETGLFLLFMVMVPVILLVGGPSGLRPSQVLFGAAWVVIFGAFALTSLDMRSSLPAMTLAQPQLFLAGASSEALANVRDPLALPAQVLHRNIDRLEGRFSVVTACGAARDRFPKGGSQLGHGYVALAADREPVALFFRRSWAFPLDRALYVEECRYRMEYTSDVRDRKYTYPSPLWGERFAKRERIKARFRLSRIRDEELQRLIDAFVEKYGSAAAGSPTLEGVGAQT